MPVIAELRVQEYLDPGELADRLYESFKVFFDLPDFSGAVCATVDPELFFPEAGKHNSVHKAKFLCRQCPVLLVCRDFALNENIKIGIWGGTTPTERRKLRALMSEDDDGS